MECFSLGGEELIEDELRREVIKWIKELKKRIIIEDKETQEIIDNNRIHRTIISNTQFTNIDKIDWIKHFFNITEEEIKQSRP